jgi:D-glycero-D-manno-heptose 1,7-bisphosphate phosphatase
VLVEEVAFLSRPDQVRALPGVGAAIQRAHRAGFRVVVCTNQRVVARG